MNPEIGMLIEVYKQLYREERNCGCNDENKYPYNVDEYGLPAVCLSHEWSRQQKLMQSLLVQREISLPIPPSVRWDERTDSLIKRVEVTSNPIDSRYVVSDTELTDGGVATSLAWYLAQPEVEGNITKRQHIVVFLDRTTVITQSYKQRETEMREALMYAPVLVFWDNQDARNGTWIMNSIRSRPIGMAFIVR